MIYKINKNALSADEKILVSRAKELADRAGYSIVTSDFLTPREQIIFYDSAREAGKGGECFFYGGAIAAERRCAVILPEWLTDGSTDTSNVFAAENEAFIASLIESGSDNGEIGEQIKTVRLTGSGYVALGHRDWLGSILALGIKRDVIGDIAVLSDSEAALFASSKIADFIADSLTNVGRDTVKCEIDESGAVIESPRTFKNQETLVASMRLDGVVKSLTNLSRSEAADLVKGGKIDLNYFTEYDVDAEINDGDILSIHGFGKYIIDRIEGHTKSGKLKMVSRKYI